MSRKELNVYIEELIHKRARVFDTTPPEFVLMMIDYYDSATNHLIDKLVDL